jgi:hypothetical protein
MSKRVKIPTEQEHWFRLKKKSYWIEIELVGEAEVSIPFEEYRIAPAKGEPIMGLLDERGWARVENLQDPGPYQVSFPGLDGEAWDCVSALPARSARS